MRTFYIERLIPPQAISKEVENGKGECGHLNLCDLEVINGAGKELQDKPRPLENDQSL
jgi:hypothetical protein